MTLPDDTSGSRLERALAVFLRWRDSPGGDPQALLADHEELRDLLEPMLGEDAGAASSPDVDGRVLGDYRLVREIGRGGMGVVYEARQISLDRRVALKVLGGNFTVDASTVARFRREATTAAKLEHQGIVQVLGVGSDGDTHYFAMEYVDGAPLDRVVSRAKTETPATVHGRTILAAIADEPSEATSQVWSRGYVESVVNIAVQVAEALEHAHNASVIHRDVKPSNVLVREDGRVLLVDFGLAREQGLPSMTMTGDFAGTPYYVSPEQAMAGRSPVDHRSDVFSLGALLYELTTFKVPFEGATSQEVLGKIVTKEPLDPQKVNPLLPVDLAAIVQKALEKDPDKRYPTAAAMAADLRAFLEYRPVVARKIGAFGRARRWARRYPARAVAVVASPVLLAAAGYFVVSLPELAELREVKRQAEIRTLIEDGHKLFVLGDSKLGVDKLRRALELDPGNAAAVSGLVFSRLDRPPDDTLAFLDQFHREGEEPRVLDLFRVQLLRRMKRDDEADALAATIPPPSSPTDFLVAGIVRLPVPGAESPDQAFREAVSLLRSAIFRSPNADFLHYHWLAFAASRAGDLTAARDCAAGLLALWPDDAAAAVEAGIALSFNDTPAAVEAFERALEIAPDTYLALRNLSLALSDLGELERAVEVDRQLVARNPRDVTASSILSLHLIKLGRFEEAAEAALAAGEAGERNLSIQTNLGSAYSRIGKFAESEPYFRRCIEMAPRQGRAHRNLVWTAMALQDDAMRLDEHERWAEANPDSARAWYELSEWFVHYKPNPTAEDRVVGLQHARRSVAVMQQDDAVVLINYAVSLLQNGESSEVEDLLRRAERAQTEADPRDPGAWLELGLMLVRRAGPDDTVILERGLDAARRAVELAGEKTSPLVILAEALQHLGRDGDAEDALSRAARAAQSEGGSASTQAYREIAASVARFMDRPSRGLRAIALEAVERALDTDQPMYPRAVRAKLLLENGDRAAAAQAAEEAKAALDPSDQLYCICRDLVDEVTRATG